MHPVQSLTTRQKKEGYLLAALNEDKIDTSDIPDLPPGAQEECSASKAVSPSEASRVDSPVFGCIGVAQGKGRWRAVESEWHAWERMLEEISQEYLQPASLGLSVQDDRSLKSMTVSEVNTNTLRTIRNALCRRRLNGAKRLESSSHVNRWKLEKGIYRGILQFHFSANHRNSLIVDAVGDLAAAINPERIPDRLRNARLTFCGDRAHLFQPCSHDTAAVRCEGKSGISHEPYRLISHGCSGKGFQYSA